LRFRGLLLANGKPQEGYRYDNKDKATPMPKRKMGQLSVAEGACYGT